MLERIAKMAEDVGAATAASASTNKDFITPDQNATIADSNTNSYNNTLSSDTSDI